MDFFPGFDGFEDVVGKDLIVFNDTSELEFLDSVSDVNLLDFLAPDQTFHWSFEDLLGQSVKIGFGIFNLNVEDNDGLGGWLGLLFLWLWLWLGGLDSWGWGVTEKIVFFGSDLLLGFLLGGLFDPLLHQVVGETVDELPPIVSVGVGSEGWAF